MKYKCLTCGQIIDNNNLCPFCGCDSSMIVPYDDGEVVEEEEKPTSSEYEESVEERYYSLFNEKIDVSKIQNVDLDKLRSLYLLAVNRGSKITEEEIKNAFEESNIEKEDENKKEIKYEQMTLPFVNEIATSEEEFDNIYNSLIRNLVDLSMNEKDELTKDVLRNLIKDSIYKTPKETKKTKEEIIDALEFLVENNKNSKMYLRYLEIIKNLFK